MPNADPYLSILMSDTPIKVGETAVLKVTCDNAGNDTITSNSLRITVTLENATVVSLSPASHWKLTKKGNPARLVNISDFGSFDLEELELIVKATKEGVGMINARIAYQSKEKAKQGDASLTNDTSTTYLTVK